MIMVMIKTWQSSEQHTAPHLSVALANLHCQLQPLSQGQQINSWHNFDASLREIQSSSHQVVSFVQPSQMAHLSVDPGSMPGFNKWPRSKCAWCAVRVLPGAFSIVLWCFYLCQLIFPHILSSPVSQKSFPPLQSWRIFQSLQCTSRRRGERRLLEELRATKHQCFLCFSSLQQCAVSR